MKEENCIFCKIAHGEIPCGKVYENEKFISFLDIMPVSDGHILIIPKTHIQWMQDLDDETTGEIFKLTRKIMALLKDASNCDFVQMSVVGTEIPHFHIHLIPRYHTDGLMGWQRKEFKKEESEKLLEKITKVL